MHNARIVESINDLVAHPPVLLSKLTIRLAVFDYQARAELWQWRPDPGRGDHLVWQHHRRIPEVTALAATSLCASYLDQTASLLVRADWPGVRF